MRQIDEAALDGYLTTWMKNKYPHLTNQFFQGKILSVSGTTAPYIVTIQRLGEPSGDGGQYVVAPTGYVPQVGDNVELMWRDAHSAYVVWPLGSPSGNQASNNPATPASWQVPAIALIEEQTFSDSLGIEFPSNGVSNLPQNFKDFRIIFGAVGPGSGTETDIYIQFNGDSSSHYAASQLYSTGSGTVSGSSAMPEEANAPIIQMPGTERNMGYGIIDIPFATEATPTYGRWAFGWSCHIEGYSDTGNVGTLLRNVWWTNNTAGYPAITSIQLPFQQALTGSARLYGIA